MDYLPAAHQTYQPAGIVYKVPEQVGKNNGGIRYYNPDAEQGKMLESDALTIETDKNDHHHKFRIRLKARENPQPSKKESDVEYKLEYADESAVSEVKTPKKPYSNRRTQKKEEDNLNTESDQTLSASESTGIKYNNKRLTDRIEKQKSQRGKFIVQVQDASVDFSKEGISRPRLSSSDKEWLEKAQYYFLNVTEGGKKIGSAESYTSSDILEALWATAETYDIDPKRFLVQIFNETRFNPNLTGSAGEKGLGQFKRSTAEGLGYDWNKMNDGTRSYAYQARCAAEFVAKVGEATYNGGGSRSTRYVSRIDRHLDRIASTKVPAKTVAKI